MTEEYSGVFGRKVSSPQDTEAAWGSQESQVPSILLTGLREGIWAAEPVHPVPPLEILRYPVTNPNLVLS